MIRTSAGICYQCNDVDSRHIEESFEDQRVAAFFDVDCTLLEVNSARKWLAYRWRKGDVGLGYMARAAGWLIQHRLGILDAETTFRGAMADIEGAAVHELRAEIEQWFEDHIVSTICNEGRESVVSHRGEGHVVSLLTSGTELSVRPLMNVLGIEHALCTEIEIVDGRVTGEYVPPLCYGDGKVIRAERFADDHGVSLERSYFYSDSYSDLPMLERVGNPRVINPDPRLRREAQRRGWEIQRWKA